MSRDLMAIADRIASELADGQARIAQIQSDINEVRGVSEKIRILEERMNYLDLSYPQETARLVDKIDALVIETTRVRLYYEMFCQKLNEFVDKIKSINVFVNVANRVV